MSNNIHKTLRVRAAVAVSAVGVVINVAIHASAITIATVPVGNPGNAADTRYDASGFGSVGYNYRIGMTEVTNAQYTDFLNAVAASDPYALYTTTMNTSTRGGIVRSGLSGSYTYAVKADAVGQGPGGTDYTYADKPVEYVSWYDAIRFANWLHNGQGSGDTENGAYTLLGGTPTPSNGDSITRNAGARWWLPSEDEWYKAAYYDPAAGVYYDYPTGTNSVPNNNLPSADTGNSANFWYPNFTTGNSSYPMTDAGAYTLSASPYGTFDQGGNVWEWNETFVDGLWPGLRGGSWFANSGNLRVRIGDIQTQQNFEFGFRVASTVPEPSMLVLTVAAFVALLFQRPPLRATQS